MLDIGIYRGAVRHRRHEPLVHKFRRSLFMVMLDADRPSETLPGTWFWSATRMAPARFRGEDHGIVGESAGEAIRRLVESETGQRPNGPIRLLTQLRYWGFYMNPVCVYFCYGADATRLESVVLEVQNTPWNERHRYVLPISDIDLGKSVGFAKTFHVSPFLPMDMTYRLRLRSGQQGLGIHLENWRDGRCVFDATLGLRHRGNGLRSRLATLCAFPFMTGAIAAGIYLEALRLWLKKTPYFPHPKHHHTEHVEVPTHE